MVTLMGSYCLGLTYFAWFYVFPWMGLHSAVWHHSWSHIVISSLLTCTWQYGSTIMGLYWSHNFSTGQKTPNRSQGCSYGVVESKGANRKLITIFKYLYKWTSLWFYPFIHHGSNYYGNYILSSIWALQIWFTFFIGIPI